MAQKMEKKWLPQIFFLSLFFTWEFFKTFNFHLRLLLLTIMRGDKITLSKDLIKCDLIISLNTWSIYSEVFSPIHCFPLFNIRIWRHLISRLPSDLSHIMTSICPTSKKILILCLCWQHFPQKLIFPLTVPPCITQHNDIYARRGGYFM